MWGVPSGHDASQQPGQQPGQQRDRQRDVTRMVIGLIAVGVLAVVIGCSTQPDSVADGVPMVYGDAGLGGPRAVSDPDGFTEGDFTAEILRTGQSPVVFTEVANDVGIGGIQAVKRFPPDCLFNDVWEGFPGCTGERMTGGVAVGDVDGDGFDDVYVTRLDGPDSLYRNNGDATFTDVTSQAGLGDVVMRSNGAGFADLTNNGLPDLVVTTMADDRFYLFINNGDGTFTETGTERGVALASDQPRGGYSVAFGDYDNDGWVDIHLTEWLSPNALPEQSMTHARLLRNRGAQAPGFFDDVSAQAGVQVGKGITDSTGLSEFNDPVFSFASAFVDLDGDGFVDLLVASDFGTTQLFWNNGDGTFTDGTAASGIGTEGNAMGLAIGDVNGDGQVDVFISAIAGRSAACRGRPCPDNLTGNRLFINQGDRTFSETQAEADVADGAWGWGTAMFDMDNDGHLDIVLTNGVDLNVDEMSTRYHGPFRSTNKRLWHNRGDGTFTEVSQSAGIDVTIPGTGLAVADLDGSGFQDVIMIHPLAAPTVWRNGGDTGNAWLRVDVEGAGPGPGGTNRDALGAIIEVIARPGEAPQVFHVGVNSHFLGQSEHTVHVGLGDPGSLDGGQVAEVRVRFPASGRQVVERDVQVNRSLTVKEPIR